MCPCHKIVEYGVRSTVPYRKPYRTVLIRILETIPFRTNSVLKPYYFRTHIILEIVQNTGLLAEIGMLKIQKEQ